MKRKIALVLAMTFALSVPVFAATNAPAKQVKNTKVSISANQKIKTGLFNGKISEINNGQITVNTSDKKSIYKVVTFNIGQATKLNKCTLKDLQVGAEVRVTHSLAMTRSLPPQSAAISITMTKKAEETFKYEGKITEVSQDKNCKLITVKTENKDSHFDTIIFTVGEDTKLDDCTLEDLKIGAKVEIVYGPVMTMSLPPMTHALEVEVED